MGRQHRVTTFSMTGVACAASLISLCTGAVGGCSRPPDRKAADIRREVLRANNLDEERRKAYAAVRVTDARGNLLPSDQRVAGVVLPRGYKPKFTFDYEWYFDGEQPYGKLVKYFTEQLDAETVRRTGQSALTFVRAHSKDNSQMKPVTVTVTPVPGREDWSRIQIEAQRPLPQHRQTAAEIEAELSLRRRNAR